MRGTLRLKNRASFKMRFTPSLPAATGYAKTVETQTPISGTARAFQNNQDRSAIGTFGRSSSAAITTPQAIANTTWTTLLWADDYDGCFAFRPVTSLSAMFIGPNVTHARFSGYVRFEANATGQRIVRLWKNGTIAIDQLEYQAVNSGSIATNCPFDFGTIPVAENDFFEIQVWQSSGASRNVVTGRYNYDIISQKPAINTLRTNRIFQDQWALAETALGGRQALINRLALFGKLAVSHGVTVGAAPNPWLGTPPTITTVDPLCGGTTGGVILDTGYGPLPDIIRGVKLINPACRVYLYVSPAIDNPAWTTCGNNTTPTTTAMGYTNFDQWMRLLAASGIPFDGWFFDHGTSGFMTAARRDEVVRRSKAAYGLPIMFNITAQSTAAVNWAGDCPHFGIGDSFAVEGLGYDNGVDVSATTAATLAAFARCRRRGITLDAVSEEAGFGIGTIVQQDVSSTRNTTPRSTWDAAAWPGDTWDYNNTNYSNIGLPAI